MKQALPGFLSLLLVFGGAGTALAASPDVELSGVVRDAHGTPQMGALVELLSAGAATLATTITDDHGRYHLAADVLPGSYALRATAAFFLPTIQPNLRLQAGAAAVVNLTMSTLFEAIDWLPVQTRRPSEPADDWKWTLRSTASRPLLRLDDEGEGDPGIDADSPSRAARHQERVSVAGETGVFAGSGTATEVTGERQSVRGDIVANARVGNASDDWGGDPAMEAGFSLARTTVGGGSTHFASSIQSHPEIGGGGGSGLSVVRLASTEQIALGDWVMIDAGTLLEAERLVESRVQSQPYLRLALRPTENTVVEYRYAAGRVLQSSADADRLSAPVDAAADAAGRPLDLRGHHQELAVERRLGKQQLALAAYHDHFAAGLLSGGGVTGEDMAAGLASPAMAYLADAGSGAFRIALPGYSAEGVSLAMTQELPGALMATVGLEIGTALRAEEGGLRMDTLSAQVQARRAEALQVTVHRRVARTKTTMQAAYRWQPENTLTQVDAFNADPHAAYLTVGLHQRVPCGHLLPQGMDAVVEASNLLEQGYQPVLAPDGHTLFLAQVPRSVQVGLAFNF